MTAEQLTLDDFDDEHGLPERIGPFELEWREHPHEGRADTAVYKADDDPPNGLNRNRVSIQYWAHPNQKAESTITIWANLDDDGVLRDGSGHLTPNGYEYGERTEASCYASRERARKVMVEFLRDYVDDG